jgi:hypothetical protein
VIALSALLSSSFSVINLGECVTWLLTTFARQFFFVSDFSRDELILIWGMFMAQLCDALSKDLVEKEMAGGLVKLLKDSEAEVCTALAPDTAF